MNEEEADDEEQELDWDPTLTSFRHILHNKNVEFQGVFCIDRDDDGPFYTGPSEQEGWLDMDQEVMNLYPEMPKPFCRFGDILQQWFLGDLALHDDLIEIHSEQFNYGFEEDDNPYQPSFANHFFGIEDDEDDDFPDWLHHPWDLEIVAMENAFGTDYGEEEDDDEDDEIPELIEIS